MKISIHTVLAALLCCIVLAATSCSEDLYPDHQGFEAVKGLSVDDIDSWGGYAYFTVERTDDAASMTLMLSTLSPWLTLTCDTLPEDGIVEVFVQANPEAEGREAVIEIAAEGNADVTPRSRVTIRQKGLADYDANDMTPKYQDFRVGWGYNAFAEYESANSLLRPVIDVNAMSAEDKDDTFQSVQEGTDFKEEFDIQCAYSLQEITSILTEKMDRSVKFLGMRKTTSRYSKITTKNLHEQCFSYTRLTKRVLRRSIDEGALQYLVMQGRPPLSEDFRAVYNTIMNTSNSTERDHAIRAMLQSFGTHIVTEASLGGAIDYMATYDRSQVSNLTEVTESHSSKIFGRKSSSESHSSTEHVTSTLSADQTFSISGGDPSLISQIRTDIRNLTSAGTLDTDLLSKWEASIVAGSDAQKSNLDLVDFRIYPIWELFDNDDVKARIQQIVLDMNAQSNNSFTDKELGLDNYYVETEDLTLEDFDHNWVINFFYGHTPVLQACYEYVPKIRGDRPVLVYYPIYGGRVKLAQGLFPGDGEGNPPAHLCFSDDDVNIQPIEGMGGRDVVTRLYLLGGNLYATDYKTSCRRIKQGDIFPFREKIHIEFDRKTTGGNIPATFISPVIKLGSGYWTTESVNAEVGDWLFEGVEGDNGIFYAALNPVMAWGPIPTIKLEHPEDEEVYRDTWASTPYGPDEDIFGQRSRWFLPRKKDYENMIKYTGGNTKALFKGQPSGFGAIFNGCYIGSPYIDFPGDPPAESNRVWFEGKKSYLLTYDPHINSFNVLQLTTDYKWKINPNPEKEEDSPEEWEAGVFWLDHLFPVRLFHDQGYNYTDK